MHLFPKTMLEVWQLYGDFGFGLQVHEEHLYQWSTTINGVTVADGYQIGEYLCPHAIPGLWSGYDLAVADGIFKAGLTPDPGREWDILYVGGGSGRFHNAIAAWDPPLRCFSLDNSDDACELMQLRGVPRAQMDGHDMSALADGSYPLVVLAPWPLDSSTDPEALVAEAVRVAGECVIASGWLVDEDDEEPITYSDSMTNWKGDTETRVGTARHYNHVLEMFEDAGATPDIVRTFLADASQPTVKSWLLVVGV